MVDVAGNTSTFTSSSESSCRLDVPDVLFVPDAPDVTELGRHDLIRKDEDDVLREIMSMTETRKSDKMSMLLFEGGVYGYNACILIDCGASHNFISENFVKHHDLSTTSVARVSVTVANGMKSYIDQALVNFELTLNNFNDRITSAYVFPIQSCANYDLILGLLWLFSTNPHINWTTRIITIFARNQKYLIKPMKSYTHT